jgi:hypothetical protein
MLCPVELRRETTSSAVVDPDDALNKYLEEGDDLQAGRTPLTRHKGLRFESISDWSAESGPDLF